MRRIAGFVATLLAGTASLTSASAQQLDRTTLPIPDPAFAGTIGQTYKDSRGAPRQIATAPKGAPNVIVVLTDDVGFGAASTFGGPVPTPNLDRLAASGLRYTRFHTTAMCSPTRAALLTGRNHQAVHSGIVTDTSSGFPGYDGAIPRSAATLARVLGENGYSTAMFGKHHNVPLGEATTSGPFNHWPTGLGFDHFYGFIGGDADQWHPRLYRGTDMVNDTPPPGETLDRLLVDDAVHWLHQQRAATPDRPFFVYLAPGSAHAPHQAPPEWIARFRGKFDGGWDALRVATLKRQIAQGIAPRGTRLSARPEQIPAWDTLSAGEKAGDARMMEVFAAMLAYQDVQFGRLLDEIERMGERDNTLILFIEGDNGGSAEGGPSGTLNEIGSLANGVVTTAETKVAAMPDMGGPSTYQLYPVGWAWATNAPFPWTKQVGSHLGGMRNGMVASWPTRITDRGGVRTQFAHVVDIAPTILDAIGLPQPRVVDGVEQQRVDGVSLTYSFAPKAAERSRTQYFEMAGNRGIYKDGWLASTTPARMPWQHVSGVSPLDYKWELYDLRSDFSQSRDLAAVQPAKLAELKAAWDEEARRNQVYPLDDRQAGRSPAIALSQRKLFQYWGAGISIPQQGAPQFGMRPFTLDAEIVVPANAQGVLLASGSRFGGWSFYLENGRPIAVHAASNETGDQYRVAAETPLPAGPVRLRYRFDGKGLGRGGHLSILAGDKVVAEGDIPRVALLTAGLGETLDTGRDTGVLVTDYPAGSDFTGTINSIEVRYD